MKLHRFDTVQIAGIFASNPTTGAPTDLLQYFALRMDVDGEVIPPRALVPVQPLGNDIETPISMTRVVSVNSHRQLPALNEPYID